MKRIQRFEEIIKEYLALENLEHDTHQYHRFYSWNVCYEAFGEFYEKNTTPATKKDKDFLALHLGMFLASWGMYRGSTFNLHYNYTIHRPIIKILFSPEAQELRKNNHDLEYLKKHAKDIKKLYNEIAVKYNDFLEKTWKDIKDIPEEAKDKEASTTLITKILLGTVGCIPAYDTYLQEGLKISEIDHSNLTSDNVEECVADLLEFFKVHMPAEVYKTTYEKDYPIMKLLDMYFWKIGEESSKNK